MGAAACCTAREKEITLKASTVPKFTETVSKQLCSKKIMKDPGFFPSQQVIGLVSEEYLMALRISDVLYRFDTQNLLTRLTYQFSDGALSPKSGTYEEEPTKRFILPQKDHVSKIEFQLEENNGVFPFRSQIFEGKISVVDIKHEKLKKLGSKVSLEVPKDSHIVSARIEVGKFFPINVHFLMYKHTL